MLLAFFTMGITLIEFRYNGGIDMDNWGVFTNIVYILTFAITIGGVVYKFSKIIGDLAKSVAELTITVQYIKKDAEDLWVATKENAERGRNAHQKLWDKNDEQDATIAEHETAIKILMEKTRKCE